MCFTISSKRLKRLQHQTRKRPIFSVGWSVVPCMYKQTFTNESLIDTALCYILAKSLVNEANSIKTKELSKQVRDNIEEKL